MRTIIIISIGLFIASIAYWLTPASQRLLAAGIFSAAWLVASLFNLRVGLSHGYTLAQELSIHLLLYGVPVAAMWTLVLLKKA